MTAPTDQFVDFATRTQELATAAVRTWTDSVQTVAGGLSGGRPDLPDAHVMVDRYFDFAQQVLDSQRRLAQNVVTAGTQAAQTVSEQAARATESATAHATNAAGATAGAAKDAGRSADEQATTTRAAKSAAKS